MINIHRNCSQAYEFSDCYILNTIEKMHSRVGELLHPGETVSDQNITAGLPEEGAIMRIAKPLFFQLSILSLIDKRSVWKIREAAFLTG